MPTHENHQGDFVLFDGCGKCDDLSRNPYGIPEEDLRSLGFLCNTPIRIRRPISMNEARLFTHFSVWIMLLDIAGVKYER